MKGKSELAVSAQWLQHDAGTTQGQMEPSTNSQHANSQGLELVF